MSKFQIDLTNYPYLLSLFEKEDKSDFAKIVKYVLENAQTLYGVAEYHESLEKYDKISSETFGVPIEQLIQYFLDAFFDYKGIVSHHPNKEEAKLLEYLDHENNPLSVFTGYTITRDKEGNPITKQEFLGQDVSFKHYLQGLLYAARYLNHVEYVQATVLNRYDLVEASKKSNLLELMKIQPALEYQKLNNLVVGSRKLGTAFFDCGTSDTNECPISKKEMLEADDGYYSLDVLAFFHKL